MPSGYIMIYEHLGQIKIRMSQLNKIWVQVGEFGSFQKGVYALLNFLTILQCCQTFLLVFIADKPQWQCSENDHSYLDQVTKNQGHPCYKNGSICHDITFDSEFTSIVTEWKLVCDQEYKNNIAQSIILAGSLLGAVVLGGMADRHGRKFAIIFMQSLAAVFFFASGLAQSYVQFVILRFLGAAMARAGGMAIFVLISEILGPKCRDLYLTVHQAFFSIGYVVLTMLAYCVHDWRNLILIISSPALVCAVFFLGDICESPQWLLETGKLDESKELLRKIAKKNGLELPEKSLEDLTTNNSKKTPKATQSLMDILSTAGYLKKIITLSSLWVCLAMLYFGLSFVCKSTSGNKYISFSLSGLVEIPSLVLSLLLIKAGRRMPLIYLCLIGALSCCVCCCLLDEDKSQAGFFITLSAMFGKFGVAASYNIVYISSAELFTATVRSFSMGICSTAASIGSILAPLVVSLEVYDKRLPMFVFGITGFLSTMLAITLPETLELQPEGLDKKKD